MSYTLLSASRKAEQSERLRAEGEQRKMKVDELAEAIIGQLIDSDEEE